MTRENLARCARSASLVLERERRGTAVLAARRAAAGRILPSNPVVSFSAGRRSSTATGSEPSTLAWDASLSQEIEIAGQFAIRKAAVDAETTAHGYRIAEAEREAEAAAWLAYFEVLAAGADVELSNRLLTGGRAVATVARANADEGLIAPIDADVADAAAVRLERGAFVAVRRYHVARLRLASLLGLDAAPPSWLVGGELAPLSVGDVGVGDAAVDHLPGVREMEAERRAERLRADAFRRETAPNPTLSVFTQNYERSFGVGISFPIPLPDPVGHANSAEVAEAEGLAQQAAVDSELRRRQARLAIASAAEEYASRRQELEAFTPERTRHAEDGLRDIADEVQAGRLAVRDAVVAEQSLIELLQAEVDAHQAVCVASVELARAAGLSLEGGR